MGVYTTFLEEIQAKCLLRVEIRLLKETATRKKWWCKIIGGNLRRKVNCLRKV